MAATGYIQVHAFTSKAQLPLKDVTVLITDADGKAIAMRQTDRSGKIQPVPILTPDLSASQTPQEGMIPFTSVNIYARLANSFSCAADTQGIGWVPVYGVELLPLTTELSQSGYGCVKPHHGVPGPRANDSVRG